MNVYILQIENDGIFDEPFVFMNEIDADKKYLELVNEYEKTNFIRYEDAAEYMGEVDWSDWGIRYFVCEVM